MPAERLHLPLVQQLGWRLEWGSIVNVMHRLPPCAQKRLSSKQQMCPRRGWCVLDVIQQPDRVGRAARDFGIAHSDKTRGLQQHRVSFQFVLRVCGSLAVCV